MASERDPGGDPGIDQVVGAEADDAVSATESPEASTAEPFDIGDGDLATRVAHAKQRHGVAGAMLAAGMLAIDQMVNGRKPREEAPITVDASGEPTDIDRDGITVALEGPGVQVTAPPLPRTAPVVAPARRGRRNRR